jgi:hypothetical protein
MPACRRALASWSWRTRRVSATSLRLYLERDGHRVTVVGEGGSAIAELDAVDAGDADPIDLVVLDLMLPRSRWRGGPGGDPRPWRHPGPHRLGQT